MEENQLIEYLSKMDNLSVEDWIADRKGNLKSVDKLRLFYLSMYEVKKQTI